MRKKVFLIIVICLSSIGCRFIAKQSNENTKRSDEKGDVFKEEIPNKEGSIVEIPVIAKLSLDELNQKFGPPEKENKKDFISRRIYSLNNGEAEMALTFDKTGSIKEIELELKTRRDTPEQVLKAGGFELGGSKPDWENSIVKDYNERVFNGVRFKEISVQAFPPTGEWDQLKVIIKR